MEGQEPDTNITIREANQRQQRAIRTARRWVEASRRLGRNDGNFYNNATEGEVGVETGLTNDEGAPVYVGTECFDTYYCNRAVGPEALPGSNGRCGPENGPQCLSCGRLQDGQRLEILKRQFPSVPDEAIVGALRVEGGLLNSAMKRLLDLGAVCEPDPRLVDIVTAYYGFPRAMVEATLRKTGCLVEEIGALLYGDMESCFQAAIKVGNTKVELCPNTTVSEQITKLGASALLFPDLMSTDCQGQRVMSIPYIIVRGHRMVPVDTGNDAQCTLCCSRFPCKTGGAHWCQACKLCEGCVQSGVVFHCPALANGGHCHHHPLEFGASKVQRYCDIRGEGCTARDSRSPHRVTWRCPTCDFDVCSACIAGASRDNFNRRTAAIDNKPNENNETNHNLIQHTRRPRTTARQVVDNVSIDRYVTERWNHHLQQMSGNCKILVGSGRVGTSFPRPDVRYHSRNRRAERSDNRDTHVSTVSVLSEEAKMALKQFKVPSNSDVLTVAATDLTLAEGLLHRVQMIQNGSDRKHFYDAVAGGHIGMAGTLLLASACTKLPQDDSTEDDAICWCGYVIDRKSAPNGAICCLSGHAMHPSCAADLLLGGSGSCPTCREVLFFPRIAETELEAVDKIVKKKQHICQPITDNALASSLPLRDGDLVQVCPDVQLCRTTQDGAQWSGGWQEDMTDACGLQGTVTRVIKHDGAVVAVRVLSKSKAELQMRFMRKVRLPHRCGTCHCNVRRNCVFCAQCETCCMRQGSSGPTCHMEHAWTWSTSLICFLKRSSAGPESDMDEMDDGDEVKAKQRRAEKQLSCLRTELLVVKAARENVEKDLYRYSSEVKNPTSALAPLAAMVSPADYLWAHHLLSLATGLDDPHAAKSLHESVSVDVAAGNLESAARKIRWQYTIQTLEQACWQDAADQTASYMMKPCIRLELLAFPSMGAPKTGFDLEPGSRFSSNFETMGEDGFMWLQVASPKLEGPGNAIIARAPHSPEYRSLVGCRVRRGKDWKNGEEDGGSDNEGVIIGQSYGSVIVEWNGNRRPRRYSAMENGPVLLAAAGERAPIQGWLRLRACGVDSGLVATRANTALCCSCCGANLNPLHGSEEGFVSADIESVSVGDKVLVAATLESVEVEYTSGDQIYCSFPKTEGLFPSAIGSSTAMNSAPATNSAPAPNDIGPEEMTKPGLKNDADTKEFGAAKTKMRYAVWYTPGDLVIPRKIGTASTTSYLFEERIEIEGRTRTRRELVLMNAGDLEKAKEIWRQASHASSPETIPYASCLKGHLLDARCFEAAMLSGNLCPAPGCAEPLFVPSVTRRSIEADNDSCQGSACTSNNIESSPISGISPVAQTNQTAENIGNEHGNLKMCPCCCSGPFVNNHCSNMSSHHGECAAMTFPRDRARRLQRCTERGVYRASPLEIAQALQKVSDSKSVTDVLPRCPTHNVVVMFNGCLSCGHLFTGTDWNSLPVWDERGKEKLSVDKARLAAARRVSAQVRKEIAMLEHERRALLNLQQQLKFEAQNE